MHSSLRIALAAGTLLFLTPIANAQVFIASLSGPAEAPPNTSPGTGFSTVTLSAAQTVMRVQISFTGLVGTTTMAHIHSATPTPLTGVAPVATPTPSFPGFPSGVTAGAYDQTFDLTQAISYRPGFITDNGGTVESARLALVSGISSQRAYVNIHTTQFGGGEIRGFLVAAPEPGALALLGAVGVAGLPILGIRRRRRK
jgi:hypothetical protein